MGNTLGGLGMLGMVGGGSGVGWGGEWGGVGGGPVGGQVGDGWVK